jgi:hypothetical protein
LHQPAAVLGNTEHDAERCLDVLLKAAHKQNRATTRRAELE